MDYGGQAESTLLRQGYEGQAEGFSLTWVFSKKFSYKSKLSTMIFSCPPEQLSVLFPPQADKSAKRTADKCEVSEKKDNRYTKSGFVRRYFPKNVKLILLAKRHGHRFLQYY
jgi:hypothetical protein